MCSRGVNITKNQKPNCFQMSTTRKIFTLAMVRKTNSILLGLKKKGFGEGKWNGFGGKVEKDETVTEGAVR
jgi:ADP-ribose pyrophosphatase